MIATPSSIEGGFQYQFVSSPADWLICSICSYPSREPYLSGCCGQTFCKSCLEGTKKANSITEACPKCENKEFVTIPHHQANKILKSLNVFCTNKSKGCEWQGEVDAVTHHLESDDGCQFEDVTCPNECGMCLQRQNMTIHVEDECVGRKVDDISDLQTQVVKIKHQLTKKFEVSMRGIRKELQSTNSIAVHNELLAEEELSNKLIGWVLIPILIVLVAWFIRHDMNKIEESFHNKLSRLDNNLTEELVGKLQVEFHMKLMEVEMAAQKRIVGLENKLQQKSDELDLVNQWFQWERNITYEAAKLSSGVQETIPVIVKMSGYKEIKADYNKNRYAWYSVSFYTHHKGYKISLQVYVSSSTHLKAHLYLERGPHDSQLWWPLKGHCEVKLLNQINDSEHYVGTGELNYNGHESYTTRENKQTTNAYMWSSTSFISYKELENVTTTRQYLKDNTVYFRVDYKLDLCNGTRK